MPCDSTTPKGKDYLGCNQLGFTFKGQQLVGVERRL